jgi:hypothetical protein
MHDRYMVVYPGGGFNDMLTAIERCLVHAIKYNRLLIIDSTQVAWFKHNIHDYIQFNHPNIYTGNTTELYDKILDMSIYPPEMGGKLKQIEYYFNNSDKTYTLLNTTITLKIDLTKDYCENVIIYSNPGSSICNPIILKYMSFKPVITSVYYDRLSVLTDTYTSVHIRNTDYASDVTDFLDKNTSTITAANILFLASDHAATIDSFCNLFPQTKTFSIIPRNAEGVSIHYNHNGYDQQQFIIDCIVDILLLASASTYIFSCNKSGYSKFAQYLFMNKSILNALVKLDEPKQPL